jgi:transposase
VVICSDEDTALAVEVLPGQAGECPRLVPLLDQALGRGVEPGEVVADKGFDGDRLREGCVDRDVNPNIPLKKNRDPQAWAFDPEGYKHRNKVERLFGKMKEFRRVATRYEKLKRTYLGFLHLVLGFLRLRKLSNVNRA